MKTNNQTHIIIKKCFFKIKPNNNETFKFTWMVLKVSGEIKVQALIFTLFFWVEQLVQWGLWWKWQIAKISHAFIESLFGPDPIQLIFTDVSSSLSLFLSLLLLLSWSQGSSSESHFVESLLSVWRDPDEVWSQPKVKFIDHTMSGASLLASKQ